VAYIRPPATRLIVPYADAVRAGTNTYLLPIDQTARMVRLAPEGDGIAGEYQVPKKNLVIRPVPSPSIEVRGTRGAAGYRKRSLYDRFLAAYLRVIVGLAQIIVGARTRHCCGAGGLDRATVIRHM
jgi:hypothetical protein